MVGRFNVAFVGVVSIGISALPYCYYESLCDHLCESRRSGSGAIAAKNVTARSNQSDEPLIATQNCRAAIFAAVFFVTAQLTLLARTKLVRRQGN